MTEKPIKLENSEISDFNPSLLERGQEIIFTLKDSNILDNSCNQNITSIKDNFQLNEIKYEKDTGIEIERPNENEYIVQKNEKIELELKDDGQIIDENILLKKFNKIQNKYQNKISSNKKRFQSEFYNEEELKLLNKKKNRKKKNNSVLFDIEVNDEVNNENNKEIKNEENIENNKNNKKALFTSEDKEKLNNLFDKKDKNGIINKKNIINIEENKIEEENNNNKNNENENINLLFDENIYFVLFISLHF